MLKRWTTFLPQLLLTLSLILWGGATAHAQTTGETLISIPKPTIYPETAGDRRVLEDAISQGADHITRTIPGLVGSVDWSGEESIPRSGFIGEYRLSVHGVSDGTSRTITLSLEGIAGEGVGKETTATPILGSWDGDLYRRIAQNAAYLVAQAEGFSRLRDEEAPLFVDELYLGELIGSTLTTEGASLYPYSVAGTADGDVVVGATTIAVRLGSDFRVKGLPGKQLLDEGNYASAMTVATTPAGTVITRPSIGRELYLYQPGRSEPTRLRNPLTGQGAIAALTDGSVVVIDYANRRAARIAGRQIFPLDLFAQEYSYIPAVAGGPEGNIWAYDTMERRVRIFSPEGEPLDSIVPMLPMDQAAGTRALTVGTNGDFLLLTTGGLWRFDRSGRAVWTISTLDDEGLSPIGQMMSVTWHQPSGSIFLADYMGQRVIRLVENLPTPPDQFTREILELNETLRRMNEGRSTGTEFTQRSDVLAAKARLYHQRGSYEMAQSLWQQVLSEDPFSMEAMEQIDSIETLLLRRQVAELDERVRLLLEEYGRETARRDYGRTIQLYERLLNLEPNDAEMQRLKRSLEERFESGRGPSGPALPLEIADLQVESLFPVLLQRYQEGDAGTVAIRNPGTTAVEIIGVSSEIEGFAPSLGERGNSHLLPGGATVTIPLSVALTRETLALQEDLPVQVVVEVSYRAGSGSGDEVYRVTQTASTTLHRRSALIWDDSAKLASFITPNEEIVAGFALRVLAELEQKENTLPEGNLANEGSHGIGTVSPRIERALRVTDAVGAYGINYVEDPRSPFSEVSGRSLAVDTVRFPRLTLYYRSGDCDDTSALLASIYEAVGLDTAIVTTPGHVLIAFDTQEPVSNRWMYETSGTTVIPLDGTLWIPIETTVLDRGFAVAWQEGSQAVRKHTQDGNLEVIPIRDARERYGALPLPEPSFAITEPPLRTIRERITRSSATVNDIVYSAGLASLEETLQERAGTRRIPILNRIGVLHGRFGYTQQARGVFTEIIELRTDYVPGYVNLALLSLSERDSSEALGYLEQADRLRPGSPEILALIARAHFIGGNGREARSTVRQLAEIDPQRAERLSIILPRSGVAAETPRASHVDDPAAALPPAEWYVDE